VLMLARDQPLVPSICRLLIVPGIDSTSVLSILGLPFLFQFFSLGTQYGGIRWAYSKCFAALKLLLRFVPSRNFSA
jgi:hypothetical protein